MDSWHLRQIDHVVSDGLSAGCMPGCVVLVGRPGETVLHKAYGLRQVQPSRQRMTADTVFDVASLTKPVATATSILVLADRGLLDLDEAAASCVPEFAPGGKGAITIRQLLTHQGGLPADNPLSDYDQGPQKAWERICKLRPCAEPGRRFIYSDIGYIVLAEVVRRVAGRDLHAFTRENVFAPVGMSETGFLPAGPLRRRCAPTLRRGRRWMKGQVHDPRAWRLGGVAGHAGLFSTARDLARYAEMMLRAGRHASGRVLSERAVREMTRPHAAAGGLRGLGWDIRSGYSANRGEALSPRAFGHGGFTGTSLWIDPELDLFVVFLSNRLHPDGRGEVNALAGRIATIAAAGELVEALRDEAGPRWRKLAASAFCIGGIRSEADRALWRRMVADLPIVGDVLLTHDAAAGLAAGSPGQTGILVVCGTGSIVYGRRADGREHFVGGGGPVLGDEASGFDIGRRGLRAVMRAADRRGPRRL